MDDLMSNPMVEAMMSNPTFMRSIMQSNPRTFTIRVILIFRGSKNGSGNARIGRGHE